MDVLKDLTDFFFKKKEINLDNFTFKLFYRGAAGLCVLASVFSAGGSYFGDPIGRVFLWNCPSILESKMFLDQSKWFLFPTNRKTRTHGITSVT